MRPTVRIPTILALLLFLGYGGGASAEGAFAKENFSNTITLTSDYVFRGLSFTSQDPALQGSFDWGMGSWYAGIWGSNIELANSSLELDYYVGYANSTAGGLDYDLMLVYYNFPSAEDSGFETDQWEFWGTFGYTIGSAYLGLFAAYSPDFTLEDGDGYYIKGSLALSLPNDMGIDFGVGYQDVEGDKTTGSSGAYCTRVDDELVAAASELTDDQNMVVTPAVDQVLATEESLCSGYSYTHWEVGLTKSVGGFDLDLRYHSTDEDDDLEDFWAGDENIDDRIVFTISRSF